MRGRLVTVKSVPGGQQAVRMSGTLRLLVVLGLGAILAAPYLAAPSAAWAAGSLYASNWSQGAVSSFSIGTGGLLTQIGTGITSTGSEPAGVALSPNGEDLYVANRAQGTVSTFSINPDGTLTQVGPPVLSGNSNSTTNSKPYGVAVSPNGQNLYVANYSSGTVSTFSIGTSGMLTQQGTGITTGSSGPGWVAVSPNGQNLYVTNYGAGTVSTFSIGAGGVLTPLGSPVSTGSGNGSGPENLAISPNGENLYVANYVDGTVSTFSVNAGGALSVQGAPTPSGATSISGAGGVAMSPDGQNLYVTNETEGTVAAFSIGAGGGLTSQGTTSLISGLTTSTAQPFGAAVSPSGQDLYVANFALGTVSTFAIAGGGSLTALGPTVLSGLNSGSGTYQLVPSPDKGPVAAIAASVSPTEAAGVFSAQPSTPGSAPIATYAWQFGDGTQQTGPLVSHTFPAPGKYTVTLTLTDTDSCSIFGPFTGQSADCTSDPAASTSHVISVPAPPSASRESITGLGVGRPKLAFALITGALAPSLETIVITLPRGLTFSSRRQTLTRYVAVTGASGKPATYSAAVRHGALTIRLASPQPSARLAIASPELSASKRLVTEVKAGKRDKRRKRSKRSKRGKRSKPHKPVKLTFRLKLTDAAHDAINLFIRATVR